jgi:hypothetical protein
MKNTITILCAIALLAVAACSKDKVIPAVLPNTATWTIDDTIPLSVTSVKINKMVAPINGANLDIRLLAGNDSVWFTFYTNDFKKGTYYADMSPVMTLITGQWKGLTASTLNFAPPEYSSFTMDSVVNNNFSGSFVLRAKFYDAASNLSIRTLRGNINAVPMN